jgi:hypothetical protein
MASGHYWKVQKFATELETKQKKTTTVKKEQLRMNEFVSEYMCVSVRKTEPVIKFTSRNILDKT